MDITVTGRCSIMTHMNCHESYRPRMSIIRTVDNGGVLTKWWHLALGLRFYNFDVCVSP
jgi:hypothetical protein